jgi:hypothetical protein
VKPCLFLLNPLPSFSPDLHHCLLLSPMRNIHCMQQDLTAKKEPLLVIHIVPLGCLRPLLLINSMSTVRKEMPQRPSMLAAAEAVGTHLAMRPTQSC